MVNLTDPNSYQPGGRTWSVAFVGTAGDLDLMTADGAGLLPSPSSFARDVGAEENDYDDETVAYWPVDSATITISETQRGETAEGATNAQIRGARFNNKRRKGQVSRPQGRRMFRSSTTLRFIN